MWVRTCNECISNFLKANFWFCNEIKRFQAQDKLKCKPSDFFDEIPSIYSAYEKYAPIHPFSRFPVDTILVLFILSLTICDGNKLHINELDIQRVVEYTFKQEETIGELEVQLHLVGVDLAIWVDF